MGRLASRVLVGGLPQREADPSLQGAQGAARAAVASADLRALDELADDLRCRQHVVHERDGLARERDVLVGAVLAQRGQQLGPAVAGSTDSGSSPRRSISGVRSARGSAGPPGRL